MNITSTSLIRLQTKLLHEQAKPRDPGEKKFSGNIKMLAVTKDAFRMETHTMIQEKTKNSFIG